MELIRVNIGEILKVGQRTPYETSLRLKVLKLTDKKCFFRELSMIYGRENLWCVAISEPWKLFRRVFDVGFPFMLILTGLLPEGTVSIALVAHGVNA